MKLKEKYKNIVIPAMTEKFGYKNKMAVPRIEKVIVNTGFGKLISGKSSDEQKKTYQAILDDLSKITGQKPALKKAKKSIAGFKTRTGMILGAAVILRKEKMYDFLDRFVSITLPRTRDFQGIKEQSVDQNGNLTYGIKEHIIFPEILPEQVKQMFGLELTVVTTAKTKKEGLELFKLLGFPLKKEDKNS